MKPEDFDLFSALVKQRSGLVLTREKAYLLESRLMPVVRKHNFKSQTDMAEAVRSKRDEALSEDIAEAMTANDSCFFRDYQPFTLFQKTLLPQFLASRAASKHIRIWSAACSSGQEAYSLAMICADEAEKLSGWRIDIVGTDLSREMIARAKTGIYSQFEVQHGLPIAMLVKYFECLSGDKWQVKENIRNMVQFQGGNLLQNFGPIGTFDIVFCRNVLSYFDPPTREMALGAIANVMAPDGVLILGKTESALNVSDKFKPTAAGNDVYAFTPCEVRTARQVVG